MDTFAIKGRPATFGDQEQIDWIRKLQEFADCKKMTYKLTAYNRTVKFYCSCGNEIWADIPEPWNVREFDCGSVHCDNEYVIVHHQYAVDVFCVYELT
jgi:hypothetical protein